MPGTDTLEKSWAELTKEEIKDITEKCQKCSYSSGGSGAPGNKTCSYILITGRRRGVRIELCEKWRQKPKQKVVPMPLSAKTEPGTQEQKPGSKASKSEVKKKKPPTRSYSCEDHLGNTYPTVAAMCRHYGVKAKTFQKRIKRGETLEQALTNIAKKPGGAKACEDHKGNHYDSITDMLEAYNVSSACYKWRKKQGWPLEKVLEYNAKKKEDAYGT